MTEHTAQCGTVMEIKHFAVHDGPGIRTTVFLKGCPLRCLWCHNPEGMRRQPQLAFYEHLCLHCGSCVPVCPGRAHRIADGRHLLRREYCRNCGTCEAVCPHNALRLYGRTMTADEVMAAVEEDEVFYRSSGGGLTLSGGEPLLQPAFCRTLLARAKEDGYTTAVDTCGAVPQEAFEEVLPFADLFLYDIKHMDPETHRVLTGTGNDRILENLGYLQSEDRPVEIRIPLIPGMNDSAENLDAIGRFLSPMKNIRRVKVLPYHDYARSKYAAVGMKDTMPRTDKPTEAELDAAVARLRACGIPVVAGTKA